jgi:hypothetical protein
VAIAVATVWAGLWLSYLSPSLPPSTAIIVTGCTTWLAVEASHRVRHGHRDGPVEIPAGA